MIAIKGMYMPKSCWECRMITQKTNCFHCFLTDNYLSNPQVVIDKDCPLIELPEENKDMSWEELKEKCKTFIVKIENEMSNIEYFEIEPCGLSFWEDGTVLDEHNDIILTEQSNFKMYQIIKALGDER